VYSVDGSNAGKQLRVTCCADNLSRTFIRPSPVYAQCNAIGIDCEATMGQAKIHFIKTMTKEEPEFCNRYTE
jgi:hypothetical protein